MNTIQTTLSTTAPWPYTEGKLATLLTGPKGAKIGIVGRYAILKVQEVVAKSPGTTAGRILALGTCGQISTIRTALRFLEAAGYVSSMRNSDAPGIAKREKFYYPTSLKFTGKK